MGNFATAQKASEEAQNANGSAMKENAKYMDSVEGKVAALKSAWSKFSNAMINSDMIKGVLTALTGLVNFLASDIGQLTIKALAFGAALKGIVAVGKAIKASEFITMFTGFTKGATSAATATTKVTKGLAGGSNTFKKFGKMAKLAAVETTTVGASMTGLSGIASGLGAVLTNPFVLAGAAAVGLAIAIAKINDPQRKFAKAQESVTKAKNDYDEASSMVEKYRKEVEKANKAGKDSSGAKADLQYWEAKAELAKQVYEYSQKEEQAAWEKTKNVTISRDPNDPNSQERYTNTGAQSLAKTRAYYNEASQALEEYNKLVIEGKGNTKEATKALGRHVESYKNYEKSLEDTKKEQKDFNKHSVKNIHNGKATKKHLDEYVKAEKKREIALANTSKALSQLKKKGKNGTLFKEGNIKTTVKQIKAMGKAMGVVKDESGKVTRIDFKTLKKGIKAVGGDAKDVDNAFKSMKKESPDIKIKFKGKDVAIKDLESVNGKLKLTEKARKAKVTADTKDAKSKVEALTKSLNKIGVNPPVAKIKGDNTDATAKIKSVSQALSNLNGKSATTYIYTVEKKGKKKKAGGTRHFATGNSGGYFGNAEVNEQGFEIIQNKETGAMRIANAGRRGVTHINQGDAVYTHGQSMRMLQKAGVTEAELLQGKTGDVGVFGVRKLEGFKKGKKQTAYNKKVENLRKKYDNAVEEAEFQQEKYGYSDDWLHNRMTKARQTYLKNLKALNKKTSGVKETKGLGTDRQREYVLSGIYETKGEKAIGGIESALEALEGGDTTAAKVREKINKARKSKLISEQEKKEYLAEIKEILADEKKETISKNIDLVENNRKTYSAILKQIKEAYKNGQMSAKEYAEYVEELNEAEVNRVQTNYERQWDYISQYVQRQIDLEAKENDVLEAKNDLLKSQYQKVKVYREGQGWVYEQNAEAVREAQENLKGYTSVWEEIQNIMSDTEAQTNLQKAGVLAGSNLVNTVLRAGTDVNAWRNIISLIGSNVGAYDLAGDLGITDPSKITKATTINGQTFNIDNIALPNVSNANDFVKELNKLANQAVQNSMTR